MNDLLQPPSEPVGENFAPTDQPAQPSTVVDKKDDIHPAQDAAVAMWTTRITKAESFWENDFVRARRCMEFAAHLQWEGQKSLIEDEYIADVTNRMVNTKVAQLYARDPDCEAKRKPRLDFQIWDEKVESLQEAVMQLGAGQMNPAAQVLLMDYLNGRNWRNLVDKVGKTLELLYNLEVENASPAFKLQMKQLVRRVVITGVGFLRLDYEKQGAPVVTDRRTALPTRLKEMANLISRFQEGDLNEDAPEVVELESLLMSTLSSLQSRDLQEETAERLVWDFPPVTTMVLDPATRQMKGFIGTNWIAQKLTLPVEYVNSFFELTGEKAVKTTSQRSTPSTVDIKFPVLDQAVDLKDLVDVFDVYDKRTKSHFIIARDHPHWIQPPEPFVDASTDFFPFYALTFNDVEAETRSDAMKVSCWPPSDVLLMMSAQTEINTRRNSQARHRRGNSPKVVIPSGTVETEDINRLKGITPEDGVAVIQMRIPPGTEVNKMFQVLQHPPVDPVLYDTTPQMLDIQQAVGESSFDFGQQQKGETATGQNLAAQSKVTAASSNVDDLDDCLSWSAKYGGVLLLRNRQSDKVKEQVGPGAVWPDYNKDAFVSALMLDIKAASSGRPNKALHVSNAQQIVPILMQLGANPQALVRYITKVLDEQLTIDEFFPLVPQLMGAGAPQQGVDQKKQATLQPPPSAPQENPGQPMVGQTASVVPQQ